MRIDPTGRGDWVTVRRASELLATLDDRGALEGLPFMPEMAELCGRRMRVRRLADRTCVEEAGLRGMKNTVLLEGARCNGAAHDGCERACLMFWKEAWLSFEEPGSATSDPLEEEAAQRALKALPTRSGDLYFCQSTALKVATFELPPGGLRYLLGDLRRGELSLWRLAEIIGRTLAKGVLSRLGLPEIGALSGSDGSARSDVTLKSGDRVRVKSRAGIAATLDRHGKNRGLTFEAEMTPYSGHVFTVARPVNRMVHETSGRMVSLNSTVMLEGVDCQGRCTRNCPRANPLFWREVWLEKVSD